MKIELDDNIAKKLNINEKEALELLAVAIYKTKKIHGTMAGRILGIGEYEFHGLLGKYGTYVNYDIAALKEDIKTIKSMDL
ncbi:MAG: UPF0175 family protein [Flavobacteriaceae bacterium]|nr:UPF0175 family protein [Flavobacteriaceae bacterium]